MTCIAALVHQGKVYMGGDSAGTSPWYLSQVSVVDDKVFTNGKMLIGACGSFRMLQLLHYSLTPPDYHTDVDLYKYMVTDFIGAVRSCLRAGGWAKRENEVESGGTFLVAFNRRLFQVQDEYSVVESAEGYDAIGSGADLALGALYASAGYGQTPEERIRLALEAAEKFNAGVRRPFHIEVLES